jgi:hypothetical protein
MESFSFGRLVLIHVFAARFFSFTFTAEQEDDDREKRIVDGVSILPGHLGGGLPRGAQCFPATGGHLY